MSVPPRVTGAIVPAAGLGTRMRPLTYACPKELLPVGVKPVLHRLMEELQHAGIERVCLVTSREKPALADYLRRQPFELEFHIVIQSEQRGLGDAVLHGQRFAAEGQPEEAVMVALGDSLIESDEPVSPSQRMMALHAETGAGVILGQVVSKERISRYGVMDPLDPQSAERDEAFALRGVVEKPPADLAPSRVAISARYLFPPSLFAALEATPAGREGGPELTETITRMIAGGEPMRCLKLRPGERRWDIGGLNSYLDAFAAYAARDRLTRGESLS